MLGINTIATKVEKNKALLFGNLKGGTEENSIDVENLTPAELRTFHLYILHYT